VGDNVVVEPAKRCEVVGVVVATDGSGSNVVGLKPVPASTPVDGAAPVPPSNKPAHRWRDSTGTVGGSNRLPVCESDQLDPTATEDAFQYARSDSGSELDLGPGLTTGVTGDATIDQHRDQRFAAVGGLTFWDGEFERVLGYRHQRIGQTLPLGDSGTWEVTKQVSSLL
jgi:hypothetical protein